MTASAMDATLFNFPISIILIVSSLVVLAYTLIAGRLRPFWFSAIGFLAFAALLFVANIDKIVTAKASPSGIELTTWLSNADQTLDELESLAKVVGSATMVLVTAATVGVSLSDDEQATIKKSVIDVLSQLKLSKADVREVLKPAQKLTELVYVYYILGQTAPRNKGVEWQKLRNRGRDNIPKPDEVSAFLKSIDELTPQREELIGDYEYYMQYGEHRRPEVWRQRYEWPALK